MTASGACYLCGFGTEHYRADAAVWHCGCRREVDTTPSAVMPVGPVNSTLPRIEGRKVTDVVVSKSGEHIPMNRAMRRKANSIRRREP